MWEQQQVLLAYFNQIKKEQKQLAKWSMEVSNDDIVIHVIDQMYNLDWFSEETMTKWEDISNSIKTWLKCIARKRYNKARGHVQESINNIMMADWNLYLDAMEAKATGTYPAGNTTKCNANNNGSSATKEN